MDSSNVVCQGGILCEKFSTVDTSKPSAPHHICKGFHTTAKNPVDIKLCLLYNTESIQEYCPSTVENNHLVIVRFSLKEWQSVDEA